MEAVGCCLFDLLGVELELCSEASCQRDVLLR